MPDYDEFGIPIKSKAATNVDEFGIPVKKKGGGYNGLGKPEVTTSKSSSPNGGNYSFDPLKHVTDVAPAINDLDVVEKQQFTEQNGFVQTPQQQNDIIKNIVATRNDPVVKYNKAKLFLQQDIDNNSTHADKSPFVTDASQFSEPTDFVKLKQDVTDQSTSLNLDAGIPSIDYANKRKTQIDEQIKSLESQQYNDIYSTGSSFTLGTSPTKVKAGNYDDLQQQITTLSDYKSKLQDYTDPIAKVQVYKKILSEPVSNEAKPYMSMGMEYRALQNPIEIENKKANLLTGADNSRNTGLVQTENFGYESEGLSMAMDAAKILHAEGKIDDNQYKAQIGDVINKQAQLETKYPEVRIQRIKGALGQMIDTNRNKESDANTVAPSANNFSGQGDLKSFVQNIISGSASEEEIQKAVSELNSKGANITDAEAKYFVHNSPDIGNTALTGRAIGGIANLANKIAFELGAESQNSYESGQYEIAKRFGNTPDKATEQPQTIISTEGTAKTNPNFLTPVQNEKAGLHNWGVGTLNMVADGVGTMAKLVALTELTGGLGDLALGDIAGTEVTGYAINKVGELAAKTALSAAQKQTLGTVAGMYIDTFPDAYEASRNFIGEKEGGEDARQLYAHTMGLLNGIAWTILPADKVLKDIINKSTATAAKDFASIIPNEGIAALKENTIKDFITNTLTETAKAQGKMESISAITQVAQYAGQALFNPQSVEDRNLGQEVVDGALQGLSFLPITLLEGRGLAKKIAEVNTLQKEAIFRVADDPTAFKAYTDNEFKKGNINEQQRDAKIQLVNTMVDIKKEVPDELTKTEKIDYASNLLFTRKLNAEKDGLKDASQIKKIDAKLKELETINDNILQNSTGRIEAPQTNTILSQPIDGLDAQGLPIPIDETKTLVAEQNPLLKRATEIVNTDEVRSEERRVGKECLARCRSRWSPYH